MRFIGIIFGFIIDSVSSFQLRLHKAKPHIFLYKDRVKIGINTQGDMYAWKCAKCGMKVTTMMDRTVTSTDITCLSPDDWDCDKNVTKYIHDS